MGCNTLQNGEAPKYRPRLHSRRVSQAKKQQTQAARRANCALKIHRASFHSSFTRFLQNGPRYRSLAPTLPPHVPPYRQRSLSWILSTFGWPASAPFLLCLLSDPEDRGDMFLRMSDSLCITRCYKPEARTLREINKIDESYVS
jgi:hypothetical protein